MALFYAFPPLQLIHPFLERIRQERLLLILVALESRSALWFPELAALSCVTPWPVPVRPDVLSQAHRSIHHNLSGRLLVWLLRAKWCTDNYAVPSRCEVGSVLGNLQSLLEKGLAFSTVKVYLCQLAM
ncbi:hypothetical protein N1851_008034 [Merluccius polli]|uniref:Uncharacterized protein n=1 Tax=Merluccius polli TaxID=89951 RepID=A0AA47N2T7_MERPO|nr:hypothetical protein N1851_008034 [Merluccius polli]